MSEKLRRKLTQLVHDGAHAADVEVEIVYCGNWVRTILADDASKLDTVRFGPATLPRQQNTAACLN